MSALWPWLLLAGMGALHGVHPANGWAWVMAAGAPTPARTRAWRTLCLVALGHAVAIAATVFALSRGVLVAGPWAQRVAGGLMIVIAAAHLRRVEPPATPGATSGLVLSTVLGSAMMATAQGAGLMLVPAFIPLCLSGGPARALTASGSLLLGLAAVCVHLLAMLITAGGIAHLLRQGAGRLQRWRYRASAPWSALVMGAIGIGMLATT